MKRALQSGWAPLSENKTIYISCIKRLKFQVSSGNILHSLRSEFCVRAAAESHRDPAVMRGRLQDTHSSRLFFQLPPHILSKTQECVRKCVSHWPSTRTFSIKVPPHLSSHHLPTGFPQDLRDWLRYEAIHREPAVEAPPCQRKTSAADPPSALQPPPQKTANALLKDGRSESFHNRTQKTHGANDELPPPSNGARSFKTDLAVAASSKPQLRESRGAQEAPIMYTFRVQIQISGGIYILTLSADYEKYNFGTTR